MARVDYDEQAARYDAARSAVDAARLLYVDAVARALGPERRAEARLLDLGAGTGQWAGLFSRQLGLTVVAVEPSAGMRDHAALAAAGDDRVIVAAGAAEAVPLRDRSTDGIWMSAVLHHLGDLGAFAGEARRVLRPGAPLLLRGFFPDVREPDDIAALARDAGLHGREGYPRMFFPGIRDVFATFPSVGQLDALLGPVGLNRESVRWIPEILATSSVELVDRMALRADTTLALLDDAEFAEGLDRARAWAAASPDEPVVAALPLVTYR